MKAVDAIWRGFGIVIMGLGVWKVCHDVGWPVSPISVVFLVAGAIHIWVLSVEWR